MKILDQYRGLRREIYVLCFGRMVTNLGGMIWPVMTMILSGKLGLSAAQISYYFVGSSIIMLPASLVGGKLADRCNKKWMIVVCDTVSIICFLLSAAIPLGMGTIILFVIGGIFQSVEYPSYDALFADLSSTKDRERAYSLNYLGGNLGMVLSPTIAGILFKDYLWLSFVISGVSIGISTILIAFLIKDITPVEDNSEEAEYQKSRDGENVFSVFRSNPLLLLYLLCGTLYSAAYSEYNFIMPLDMAAVHGDLGAVIYGTASSFNCITVVLFTPLITKLFVKMRDTGKMITGRALAFAGYVIFLLILGWVPGYYVCMLVFTWGEIFSTISEGPYVSSRIPASHRGRINSLMGVAYTTVMGFVDIAAGRLYDSVGSTRTWMFILTVMALSIVCAVILKRADKKVYPKLYGESAERTQR